ncbi:MAG: PASTA domain-containing protein [Phascolarctobacterium faecium]
MDEEYDEKVTPGYVIKQEPEGISKRKEGSEITLVVSKGLEMLEMPDLIEESWTMPKVFMTWVTKLVL